MHAAAFAQVAHLELDRFTDPQSARVDQPEQRAEPQLAHDREQPRDLFAREHNRQLLRRGRAHQIEQLPVSPEVQPEVSAHRCHRGAHRRRRVMMLVLQPQQVRAHRRFIQGGRIPAVPRRQLAHEAHILVLRSLRERAQPHRFCKTRHRLAVGRVLLLCPAQRGGVRGLFSCRFGFRHTPARLACLLPPAHRASRDAILPINPRSPTPRSGFVHPAATAQRGHPSVFERFTRIRNSILARPAWLILNL